MSDALQWIWAFIALNTVPITLAGLGVMWAIGFLSFKRPTS